MKIVVFITGTNAVGKSSLAWSLIDRFGGIYEERACTTICKDKRYGLAGRYKDKRYGLAGRYKDKRYGLAGRYKDKRYGLAGRYKDKRYGGVDRITNEKGSSCTSRLAEVVREGLKTADVMFCEGSFMNTFGLNLTNALFLGDAAVVVSLYAPPEVIYQRLTHRSNGLNGKRNWPTIFRKQKQALIAAQKYEQIGCKVLQFDTSVYSVEQVRDEILNTLRGLGYDVDKG